MLWWGWGAACRSAPVLALLALRGRALPPPSQLQQVLEVALPSRASLHPLWRMAVRTVLQCCQTSTTRL